MKKTAILLFAAAALLTSCAKSDKCKCSFEVNVLGVSTTVNDVIVENDDDKRCSQYKVEDLEGENVSVELSNVASINCVNYND